MYVVLLTGGLASGKDTVGAFLSDLGATVLDTDKIAKEAQEDEAVLAQLREEFGDDIVDTNGLPDRRILAERAFSSREATDRLNAICWPPVKERISDFILTNSCQPMDKSELLVILIPLLAEAPDFITLADEVITVVADEETRFERAVARGMSAQDARRRLDLQASDDDRVKISDTVFDNNGNLKQLADQVRSWYSDKIESRMF
jgi:dephospho-CoA kinase